MNLEHVEQIAKAVLYEGYMLYPYRPSSVKNQQRFNFGVAYPELYTRSSPDEACSMQSECLVRGDGNALVEARLRFLQLQVQGKAAPTVGERTPGDRWQQAVERDIPFAPSTLDSLCTRPAFQCFQFPSQTTHRDDIELRQEIVEGILEVSAEKVGDFLYKVSFRARNTTPRSTSHRDAALMHSLVSTHMIFGVSGGEFISLLESPDGLQMYVERCKNSGLWPILVGEPGRRDTMLASPIILYDYPQIAPESAGDLFDGTEIDEILSLRIMTLTDEEKNEIRHSDERARLILERTESMPVEQFMKLHGTARSLRPLRPNSPEEDIA